MRANASKEARFQAEAAEQRARGADERAADTLEQVRTQAAALDRLARVAEGPPLVAEFRSETPMTRPGPWPSTLLLTNRQLVNKSARTITIVDIANVDQFDYAEWCTVPCSLEPGQSQLFAYLANSRAPGFVSLGIRGTDEQMHVSLQT